MSANYYLIRAARDLMRIRNDFGSLDDVFRNKEIILKYLIKLTDCNEEDCREAMRTVFREEKELNAQG